LTLNNRLICDSHASRPQSDAGNGAVASLRVGLSNRGGELFESRLIDGSACFLSEERAELADSALGNITGASDLSGGFALH
jgi:hypothetical protein